MGPSIRYDRSSSNKKEIALTVENIETKDDLEAFLSHIDRDIPSERLENLLSEVNGEKEVYEIGSIPGYFQIENGEGYTVKHRGKGSLLKDVYLKDLPQELYMDVGTAFDTWYLDRVDGNI